MSALETTADAGAGYQDGEVNDEDYIEELHEELQAQKREEELQEGREEVHRQQRAGWFTTEEQLATAATAACVFLLAR